MKKIYFLLGVIGISYAQTNPDDSLKIFNLNEVIYSVNNDKDEKDKNPYYVNTINRTQIENTNASTTADLLQSQGNVLVQKSQLGGGSPIIRGFEASRVLIVVDGVRMNNAIFRGGHLQNVLRIDQNDLERAEVMFGPGSVLYGSDALGGTMYFKTKEVQLSTTDKLFFKGNAMLRTNSAMFEKTGHLDFNFGGKKFGSYTGLTFTDFDDVIGGSNGTIDGDSLWDNTKYVERINGKDSVLISDNPNIQRRSGFMQWNLIQKFLFKPNEDSRHELNIQYSSTGAVNRFDRLSELDGSGKPRWAEWYYGPETWVSAGYRYVREKNNWKYNLGATYQYFNESRISRRLNNNNKRIQDEKLHAFNLNFDITRKLNKHELKFGFEGVFNTITSTAEQRNVNTDTVSNSFNTRYPDGGNLYYTAAIYFHDTWTISEKLTFTGGVRLNYVGLNSTFNDTTFFPFPFKSATQNNFAVNGHLGLIVTPGKGFRFNVLASTGFRNPNVDDLSKVFETTNSQLIIPNPTIAPEYSINGEIGISKTFFDKIRVDLVGFGSYLPSHISLQRTQLNGQDSVMYNGDVVATYANTNALRGYVLGFNFNVLANITSYFAIQSSLNYTYGRTILNDSVIQPLDHIAPLYGRTAAILNYKKWYGEFSVFYSAAKPLSEFSPSGEDNLQYATPFGMPEWTTINAKVGFSVNKYFRIQVACDNILDTKYRTFASGITAPGRNFILTIRSSF